jgi:hypothetical protein
LTMAHNLTHPAIYTQSGQGGNGQRVGGGRQKVGFNKTDGGNVFTQKGDLWFSNQSPADQEKLRADLSQIQKLHPKLGLTLEDIATYKTGGMLPTRDPLWENALEVATGPWGQTIVGAGLSATGPWGRAASGAATGLMEAANRKLMSDDRSGQFGKYEVLQEFYAPQGSGQDVGQDVAQVGDVGPALARVQEQNRREALRAGREIGQRMGISFARRGLGGPATADLIARNQQAMMAGAQRMSSEARLQLAFAQLQRGWKVEDIMSEREWQNTIIAQAKSDETKRRLVKGGAEILSKLWDEPLIRDKVLGIWQDGSDDIQRPPFVPAVQRGLPAGEINVANGEQVGGVGTETQERPETTEAALSAPTVYRGGGITSTSPNTERPPYVQEYPHMALLGQRLSLTERDRILNEMSPEARRTSATIRAELAGEVVSPWEAGGGEEYGSLGDPAARREQLLQMARRRQDGRQGYASGSGGHRRPRMDVPPLPSRTPLGANIYLGGYDPEEGHEELAATIAENLSRSV